MTFRTQPGGERTAYKFTRNCGATTDLNVQVSILGMGDEPDGKGNAFIADGKGAQPMSDVVAGVNLKWNGSDLQIEYDHRLRIFKKESQVDGITLHYVQR